MGDPLKGQTFNIGGEDRRLLFTLRAQRLLEKAYPGRRVTDVVVNCSVDVVCEMGAAALAHTGAVTPDRVEGWLDTDPEKLVPFYNALLTAWHEGYRRTLPADVRAQLDKVVAEAEAKQAQGEATTTEAATASS